MHAIFLCADVILEIEIEIDILHPCKKKKLSQMSAGQATLSFNLVSEWDFEKPRMPV